jgi:hypothetical protein
VKTLSEKRNKRIKPVPPFYKGRVQKYRCPPGYHLVMDHFRNRKGSRSMALEVEGEGVYVDEYCAKNPKRRR